MIHNKYFEIMGCFLKGYNKEIYGRELIGKVRLSQKNIALTLNEMEEKGILSSKMKGNLRYYFLNKINPLAGKYILSAEVQKSIEFLGKNARLLHLFEKINFSGILCIFGSYAKGIQKKDSDLDLFIAGKFDEKGIRKIGEDYGFNISIKGHSFRDFSESLKSNNPLMNEILENHIVISGYEDFIEEVTKQKW